jgi:hypothetical protein
VEPAANWERRYRAPVATPSRSWCEASGLQRLGRNSELQLVRGPGLGLKLAAGASPLGSVCHSEDGLCASSQLGATNNSSCRDCWHAECSCRRVCGPVAQPQSGCRDSALWLRNNNCDAVVVPTCGIRSLGGCVAVSGFGPTVGKPDHCCCNCIVWYTTSIFRATSAAQLCFGNQGITCPGIRTSQTQRIFCVWNSSQHSVRKMCWLQLHLLQDPHTLAAALCSCQWQVRRSAAWRSPAGSAAPAHAAAPA